MHQPVEKKLIKRSKSEKKNEKIQSHQYAILSITLIWIEINPSTLRLKTYHLKTPTKKIQVEIDQLALEVETHWRTLMSYHHKLLLIPQLIFSNSRLKIKCRLTLQKLRGNQMHREKSLLIFQIRIQKIKPIDSIAQWKSHQLRRMLNYLLNQEAISLWRIEKSNHLYESNWSLSFQKNQSNTCHCFRMKIHMKCQSNLDQDLRIKTNSRFETKRIIFENSTRITHM